MFTMSQHLPVLHSPLALAGSRSLSTSALVVPVVAGLLASPVRVSLRVGCCVGADALAVVAALAWGGASRLSVFAAFGTSPTYPGACSLSAVEPVAAAVRAGASVRFLAGGPLSLPLSARLWRRSCAVVRGAGALLLFEPGAGSLAVAGFAVGRGLPVVAFGAVPPGAPRGCEGSWESRRLVFPCWGWVPAADQLSLWGEVEAPATSSPLALS